MAQGLKAHTFLVRDVSSVPSIHVTGSRSPITPSSGAPTPLLDSAGTYIGTSPHKYTHTQLLKNKKEKENQTETKQKTGSGIRLLDSSLTKGLPY